MATSYDPAKDLYKGQKPTLAGPGRRLIPITKADTDQATYLRKIYIGGAGNLVVIAAGDDDTGAQTFAVTAGQWFDQVLVRRVTSATTATGLIGVP